jgi:hypothetical protein
MSRLIKLSYWRHLAFYLGGKYRGRALGAAESVFLGSSGSITVGPAEYISGTASLEKLSRRRHLQEAYMRYFLSQAKADNAASVGPNPARNSAARTLTRV